MGARGSVGGLAASQAPLAVREEARLHLAGSVGIVVALTLGANALGAATPERQTVICDQALSGAPAVTYHEHVSAILRKNCVGCHRDGGIAPFALDTYDRVVAARERVDRAVRQKRMPPWFANPEYGTWANDRSLDQATEAVLRSWLECGVAEGDPSNVPAAADEPAPEWSVGTPDVVFQIPQIFELPEEGVIPYQYVVVPTHFAEAKWVEAVQVRPTAPEVAHHVVVDVRLPDPSDPNGLGVTPAALQGSFGYFALAVPGQTTGRRFGEGRAKRLPAGTELIFQLHYTPHGMVARDQSMVGLVFSDAPPAEEVETLSAFNTEFVIPPGEQRYEVRGDHVFVEDGKLLSFMPHAHMRAVAFRYEVVRSSGGSEIVLDIPRYDMDWQSDYILAEPLSVVAGDILRATAWYDNSRSNPHNPDPTVDVRWGEQSWEEMMIGYFDWVPGARQEGGAARGDPR